MLSASPRPTQLSRSIRARKTRRKPLLAGWTPTERRSPLWPNDDDSLPPRLAPEDLYWVALGEELHNEASPRTVDNRIITDLGVIDVGNDGLILRELASGVTVDEIQATT